MDSTPVFFDRITLNEVYDAHAIETLGYPADETDTLDTFLYRHTHAPDLFVGAFVPSAHSSSGRTLVGFITGTRTVSPTFTKASMYTHAPGGSSVCVQSLCVAPSFRRKYIGRGLWRRFLSWVEETSYERVILIAHRELVPFYKKVGFGVVGLSSIIYGSKPWFEMCKYRKDRLPRVELVPQVASMIAYRPNPPYHDSHPSPQSPSSDYNGDNDVEPVGLSKGRTPVIAYSVPKFSEVIVAGR